MGPAFVYFFLKFQKHYVYNYALGLDFGFSMLLPSLVVLSTLIVC